MADGDLANPSHASRGLSSLSRVAGRFLARTAVRRVAAIGILVLPALFVACGDWSRRASRLRAFGAWQWAAYVLAFVESGLLWSLLLLVASRRRGIGRWVATGTFVVLAIVTIGGQGYFYDQFRTYLNLDAALLGASVPASFADQLRADGATLLHAELLPGALSVLLIVAARRAVRPRRRWMRASHWLAFVALSAALTLPCSDRGAQAATPDILCLHAFGGLLLRMARGRLGHVTPGLRVPEYVPALAPASAVRRNVLLVVTESVRFDAVCVEHQPGCTRTPFTDAAVPGRFPLLQMRAADSTTAISIAVMWSGFAPTETREAIHRAPLVFDYAHAAGYDAAYWTSQNLMFADAGLFVHDLPVSHHCGAAELEPNPHIDLGARDALLTARVIQELPELREPWISVVQYSNTHYPYRVDAADQPFQPASESKAPEDAAAFVNRYRNAVYAQDRTIADLVRWIRSGPWSERTVVLFTSDHGEAFREHGQLGHTGSVFDEELRVPAWLDAPPALLSEAEKRALAQAKGEATFHLDIAPTVLDLIGVWDSPELARFRERMPGTSLLRQERTLGVVPLTNCAPIWGCAFRNWGVMQGMRKLEAREWDTSWHCWDLAADPFEQHPHGEEQCGDLADAARKTFGLLPKDSPVMPMEP